MFNQSYEDYNTKMERTADILYPTMKNKITKPKNLPLGKSIYDDDDDDNLSDIKNKGKVKSELEALNDLKIKKNSSEKNDKKTESKSRKDRTPEEDEEILDLMYPSMKNKKKTTDEEKEWNVENKNNLQDKNQNDNSSNKKTENSDKSDKIVKSDNERNRDALKVLGMDENKYQIKGNTISPKTTPSKYEIINGVKYPKDINNSKIDTLKQLAREDIKQRRGEYLKHNAKLEQFGVDHVDNFFVKLGDKLKSGTNEAVENLHMSKTDSFLNTDYAKKHKVMNSYKEEPEYLHEYYKKKIPSQGEDVEKLPGILIDEKSESSKNLKNSLLQDSVFMDKLKKYSNAMHKGYAINDSMDFEDKNWHNALGKADIVNMHKNKQGDIELDIVDVNNYNEGESNKMVQIGRDRQEKGEIKPYFIRYHVIIPKDSKIGNAGKK